MAAVYPGAPAAPEFYTLLVNASFDPSRVGREVQVPASELLCGGGGCGGGKWYGGSGGELTGKWYALVPGSLSNCHR